VAIEVAPFDPWTYDTDGSCYIEFMEWYKATEDYSNGLITETQRLQVDELFQYKIRKPACIKDYLSISKDELHNYLMAGAVADDWWSLSEADRKMLALKIIDWWSVPLGVLRIGGYGDLDCEGNIHTQENVRPCFLNGLVRLTLFSGKKTGPSDQYYLYRDKWYCLHCQGFGLPVYMGVTAAESFGHFILAFQVGTNQLDFASWVFFQYGDNDIHIGEWQMPTPGEVYVRDPWHIDFGSYNSDPIAHWELVGLGIKPGDPKTGWEITEAGDIPYYGPWEK
jgi:hypothetical protein